MNKPFFSIIIPTFNQSTFLEKAIKSVLNQTYKNFELIVIDNSSNDDTPKVIKKYKKKIIYKRINNKGLIAKSRNLGIKIASGKWLAFLDSDDYWKKNKLSLIYKLVVNSSINVVCHGEWYIYPDTNKIKYYSYGPFEKNFYEKMLRYGNRFSTSASLVNRIFLYEKKIFFDEKKEFISSEDYSFFMNLAKNKAKFLFLNEPLGYHLFHPESISSKILKHLKSSYRVKRYHIFKIQKFSKNKKKLWQESKLYLDLKIILFNLNKKKIYYQIKNLVYFFIKKPIYTMLIISRLILKKLKDSLLYILYIN